MSSLWTPQQENVHGHIAAPEKATERAKIHPACVEHSGKHSPGFKHEGLMGVLALFGEKSRVPALKPRVLYLFKKKTVHGLKNTKIEPVKTINHHIPFGQLVHPFVHNLLSQEILQRLSECAALTSLF